MTSVADAEQELRLQALTLAIQAEKFSPTNFTETLLRRAEWFRKYVQDGDGALGKIK